MSILVVGSVALDSVKTPFGEVKQALGGSGTYFSISASYFTKVNLVAVVGKDFPEQHIKLLQKHKVNTEGLKKVSGKTFRWKGEYTYDLNRAITLDTQLNVFAHFRPEIPRNYRKSEFVFLGNIDPELQLEVLKQVEKPKLVACDTMNFWIERKRKALIKVLKYVDILIINEAEARQLASENNLVKAARIISSFGPKSLVVKRGEYGALFFNHKQIFSAPAYPLEIIFDPTGAGDSFAGGFMGYIAGCKNPSDVNMRRAIVFGSVMASFNVEDFSLNRLKSLNKSQIMKRFQNFKELTHFEVLQ
ncbi:MAG: PfkB family carbohydrate kinase [Elusimicrobia bacterium]|nr:PfkB family carbohydrate kinase [Elusimicrobiota bacterium]